MDVLRTERLTLRWIDEGDAAFVLALMNEPSWIANIGDRGLRTLDDARGWIAEKLVSSYWQNGLGLWAVVRRSDGELLGMCGLLERDSLPSVDVGYALFPRFWGQGYARESTSAVLRYAREALGRRRVLAVVQPENRASIRVLESMGMVRAGTHLLEAGDCVLERYEWGEAEDALEPEAAIDALVARFFAMFSTRRAVPWVAALPSVLLPEARVTVVSAACPRGIETLGMRDFLLPRAALLFGGRLAGFDETEVAHQTRVDGALAHRASRYRKTGTLDGVAFEGAGTKHFQLVETRRGWKIAALVWEDGAPAR